MTERIEIDDIKDLTIRKTLASALRKLALWLDPVPPAPPPGTAANPPPVDPP
jgi:hypothetical protein